MMVEVGGSVRLGAIALESKHAVAVVVQFSPVEVAAVFAEWF